jgi:hypothetical protein
MPLDEAVHPISDKLLELSEKEIAYDIMKNGIAIEGPESAADRLCA